MVENSINRVPKPNVGIIVPPDDKVSSNPYDSYEATKRFNALNRDIYQAQKALKFEDTKLTPKGLFTSIAIAAGGVLLWKSKAIPKLIKLIKQILPPRNPSSIKP